MQASDSNTKRVKVILLLLYYRSISQNDIVYISTSMLAEWGISSKAYNRTLEDLEKRQLVELVKEPGRKKRVKLLGAYGR